MNGGIVILDVIAFGETMAAFTPLSQGPLRYVPDYRMRTAGSESNLAIGLAKLGHSAGFISRLGEDEFGHYILNFIRGEGVDVSRVIMDDAHPTGVMFKQTSSIETSVFYYRAHSAASYYSAAALDEGYIESARMLYLTGITPLLSPSCLQACSRIVTIAGSAGIPIVFDPNIRMRLWGKGEKKQEILALLMQANIVLMGMDEARLLLNTDDIACISDMLFGKGHATHIALKDGARGAHILTPLQSIPIPPYPCQSIDSVGAGDAFNAGFLSGLLQGLDVGCCGEMGAICGALATQTTGDIEGYPSKKQLDTLLGGGTTIYR